MKIHLLVIICLLTAISSAAQQPDKKAGITISLPYVNSYRYHDYGKNIDTVKSGFGGIGVGTFYRNQKNKFTLNSSVTADLPAPIGPIDYGHEGTRHSISALFIDLVYHRQLYKGLHSVAGINNVWYNYHLLSYEDTIPSFKKRDHSIGISIGAEYKFRRSFSIAALYRPSLTTDAGKQYRHLLTLDFRFDITIWKND